MLKVIRPEAGEELIRVLRPATVSSDQEEEKNSKFGSASLPDVGV
jgi:hypothetical protein